MFLYYIIIFISGLFLGICYIYFKFLLQKRVLWKIGKKVLNELIRDNKRSELKIDKKTYTLIDLSRNEDVKDIDINNELPTMIYFDKEGKLKYKIRYKGRE